MENQGFVKTSQLTGAQKAAILLGEIGPARNDNYNALLEAMHLTPKEMKKIRFAFKSLPLYLRQEPKNIREIYREQDVLESCLRYGEMKGIYNPEEHKDPTPDFVKNDRTGVGKLVAEDPGAVARIIGQWLDK